MKNSRRQNRIRYKLKKVTDRKRLSVFKSNNHLYAQIINDEIGATLASVSSLEKSFKDKKIKNKKELAEKLGKSYNMVNSYVQNRRQPSIEDLFKIAEILNVEAKELLIDRKEN